MWKIQWSVEAVSSRNRGWTLRFSTQIAKVNTNSQLNGVLALPGCNIGKNTVLQNVLIDNQCQIPDGTQIGVDHEADRKAGFHVTEGGIVVVNRKMLGQGGSYLPGIIVGPDNIG